MSMTRHMRYLPTSSMHWRVALPIRSTESSNESGSSVTYGSTFLSSAPVTVVGSSAGDDDIPAVLARDPREALIGCVPREACVEVVAGMLHHRAVDLRLGATTKAKTPGDWRNASAKHTPSVALDRCRGPVIGAGLGGVFI